jgi:topoisomerase IV subunit B
MPADDLLSGASAATAYDASHIEVLEGLEPVRKRPGMYIGGTDERALHHLAAEVLDNAMDEAVAGHASRIEVELHADYSLTVRDNGRGIPVDPHPKFPDRSALEVIMCTLHSGGKFSGKVYQTSGGLHGVGASVVNALSDRMRVEVARNRELFVQEFARGIPLGSIEHVGPAPNRRGTSVSFHPDAQIFGHHRFRPTRLFRMARSKAYLFSGVEIRWKSAIEDGDMPLEASFRFPGGLADYLGEQLAGATTYSDRPFAGKVSFEEKFDRPGTVEWAINWTPARDGFTQSYCNTVPTPEGGTHEQGFWAAILKGIRAYGELAGNRKAAQITREDLAAGGCALVSCFIREPEFVGQTKDRLATAEAAKLVEGAVRDHFDNWLAADPKSAGAILDYLVLRAEERLRRRAEKETQRSGWPSRCGGTADRRHPEIGNDAASGGAQATGQGRHRSRNGAASAGRFRRRRAGRGCRISASRSGRSPCRRQSPATASGRSRRPQHLRMHHARAEDLHPVVALADLQLPASQEQRISTSAEGSVNGKCEARKRSSTLSTSKKARQNSSSVHLRLAMDRSRSIASPST